MSRAKRWFLSAIGDLTIMEHHTFAGLETYRLLWFFVLALIVLALIVASVACTSGSHPTSNQANLNQNAPQSKSADSNSTPKPEQTTTGSIEVVSAPPGARVLLVPNDESGAGEPQAKGVTPTTITGLAPGKYTVDLEKPGYRFFQKEIVVMEDKTTNVSAALKRQ